MNEDNKKISTKVCSISEVIELFKKPVKVRHVSDQSISRCNKTIEPLIKENRKVLQRSLEGANEHRIGFKNNR